MSWDHRNMISWKFNNLFDWNTGLPRDKELYEHLISQKFPYHNNCTFISPSDINRFVAAKKLDKNQIKITKAQQDQGLTNTNET